MTMTDKIDFLRRKTFNQADEIRQGILYVDDASVGLGKKSREFVIDYLSRLDSIYAWLSSNNTESRPDLTGEQQQLVAIQRRFMKNAASILPVLGGEAGLRSLRPETATEAEQPWWFIDRHLSRQKQGRRKLTLQIAGVVIAFLAAALFLMAVIFQPDYVSTTVIRHTDRALEAIILEDDYQMALTEVDQALASDPENLSMLILRSIILEELGQPIAADRSLQSAYQMAAMPEVVPYERGRYLMQMAHFEAALAEADRTIDLNPNFAEGWLLKGQVHDRLHQIPYAFDALTIAAQLAVEQKKYTLEGIIRFNIENLANSARRPPDTDGR